MIGSWVVRERQSWWNDNKNIKLSPVALLPQQPICIELSSRYQFSSVSQNFQKYVLINNIQIASIKTNMYIYYTYMYNIQVIVACVFS